MSRLIYINGELLPKDQAKISVFDHGLLYGDGVFEGIRTYGGRVFRLEKHLRRLYAGAEAIRLTIPLSQAQMAHAVTETVAANGDLSNGYIRLVVTRGVGTLGLNPMLCGSPQVIIIVDTITLYPKELYENGLKLITATTVRNHPKALNPFVKSLNYLNNILAKLEGIDAGVPEALMLNHEGYVAEATGDNVFIVHNGVVQTPPVSAGILEGITRGEVIDICREQGREVQEVATRLKDMLVADECFLTGTAAEVVPVVSVDGRAIGDGKPGPVTLDILGAFHRRTQTE